MKTLDLTNAKLLKKFSSVEYNSLQLESLDTDICTLARMCVNAFFSWVAMAIIWCVLLTLALFALTPLVLLTLSLPDGWQVSLFWMNGGITFLIMYFVAGVVVLFVGIIFYLVGRIPFAPEYITKHFHKKDTVKQKQPSQTWIAVKEMYRSFKDKTCVKVKL
jgi:hypothetical protein